MRKTGKSGSNGGYASRMLLRLPEVKAVTGLSRSTIYSWISAGRFPQPIKLGLRTVALGESRY